ncbi:MAG: histidine phosphatase family protein [Candidatus Aenigmatarchaeota archaeon]
MRLILIRHGETTWNIKQLIQGQKNTRLTKVGKQQVKMIAKKLSKEKIDVIYSSDLQRCKSTTNEIAKTLKLRIPIHYTHELRERNFGVFEGKKRETLHKYREKLGIPHHVFKPDGGESYVDVQKRIIKFFNKIKRKYKNKTVVFITHGGIIKVLLFYLMNKSLERWNEYKIENASISIIEFKPDSKIKLINYTDHLLKK